jgi:hypothetical protein
MKHTSTQGEELKPMGVMAIRVSELFGAEVAHLHIAFNLAI